MTNLLNNIYLKVILSSFGGVLLYLVGVDNLAGVGAIATLCLLDFLLALYVVHVKRKHLVSRRFLKKLKDFSVYFAIIVTMNLMTVTANRFGVLVEAAIIWCAATEALSILEHMSELGYKIPVPLLDNLNKERNGENTK